MSEYIHPELNQRVEFFGGGYSFLEEGKITHEGKEVLYLLGTAAVESSCCGRGGCAFIKGAGLCSFPGRRARESGGEAVSEIERIVSRGKPGSARDSAGCCKENFQGSIRSNSFKICLKGG